SEPDVAIAAAPRGGSSVSRDLRRLRADLEEEAALVRGLPSAKIFDLDRVRRRAPLVVEHLDLDEVRSPHLGTGQQLSRDRQAAQAELAEHAGDDDQREQHAEQEVEQVVARVDRGEAHAERDADEVFPLARQLELARWLPALEEAAKPALGRRFFSGGPRAAHAGEPFRQLLVHSGTGTRATIS